MNGFSKHDALSAARRCTASRPGSQPVQKRSVPISNSSFQIHSPGPFSPASALIALLSAALIAGCSFAPKYKRPDVETPTAFKEAPAETGTNQWKTAQPSDAISRGKWWEIFNDEQLNALEAQVAVSNQNVAVAFANFISARAIAKQAQAQLYPTLAANPSIVRQRQPLFGSPNNNSGSSPQNLSRTTTDYLLPLDASWQLDLWGKIRNGVRADVFEAQATAADVENTRLTAQAELASDYFQLRAQDALIQLFKDTVKAYRESLELTKVRYQTGIASDEDVAQAETQLATTESQAINLGILRAQMEHAIAVLIGRPPASLTIPPAELGEQVPPVPAAVPSELLERRPDIAGSERRVAEANARIGVAKAAFFPNVTLSASGGFESFAASSVLDWSSRIWSAGAGLSETLFDAGARAAAVRQSQADYQSTVARYRQTVLTAFQQVEDNLASLNILTRQIEQQTTAVKSSDRFLTLATDRYKLGIDSYLNVITAQTAYLNNRQTLVNLHQQRMAASVQLVEAIGGGWAESDLPSQKQVLSKIK